MTTAVMLFGVLAYAGMGVSDLYKPPFTDWRRFRWHWKIFGVTSVVFEFGMALFLLAYIRHVNCQEVQP